MVVFQAERIGAEFQRMRDRRCRLNNCFLIGHRDHAERKTGAAANGVDKSLADVADQVGGCLAPNADMIKCFPHLGAKGIKQVCRDVFGRVDQAPFFTWTKSRAHALAHFARRLGVVCDVALLGHLVERLVAANRALFGDLRSQVGQCVYHRHSDFLSWCRGSVVRRL